MTSRDFCLWLQGFLEMSRPDTLNRDQVVMLRQHLNLVFKHEIDPSAGTPEHQAELNVIHSGGGISSSPLIRC